MHQLTRVSLSSAFIHRKQIVVLFHSYENYPIIKMINYLICFKFWGCSENSFLINDRNRISGVPEEAVKQRNGIRSIFKIIHLVLIILYQQVDNIRQTWCSWRTRWDQGMILTSGSWSWGVWGGSRSQSSSSSGRKRRAWSRSRGSQNRVRCCCSRWPRTAAAPAGKRCGCSLKEHHYHMERNKCKPLFHQNKPPNRSGKVAH